ncbi:ribulose-phosphate 3-epimerase [Acidobacteria bacterium ACD]|nr:MAG: ribulose-phosphate 3-epimerase [Acidobacteriota bacterium]MDL1949494.1 ribulose-phosphate 3-epimerase [Acidobacteria bacterium ACD]
MTSVRVAPSLLSADFGRLSEAVAACESGGADAIHFDVMDGRFVPSLTVGPLVLRALRKETRLPFDVHLMIEEPFRTLDQYLDAGAARVSVHVEAEPHLHRFAAHVRSRGASPGVAVNPGTSLAALDEALGFVDFVLVMSVDPGWGGQPFLPAAVARVARLRAQAEGTGHAVEIAVDGGVGVGNAAALAAAGARFLVAGSAVFGTGDVPRAIEDLRAAAGSLP